MYSGYCRVSYSHGLAPGNDHTPGAGGKEGGKERDRAGGTERNQSSDSNNDARPSLQMIRTYISISRRTLWSSEPL